MFASKSRRCTTIPLLAVLVAAIASVAVADAVGATSDESKASPVNACKYVTLQEAAAMLGEGTSRFVADPPTCAYAAASSTPGVTPILSIKAWKNGPQQPIRGRGIETKRVALQGARCWHTTFPTPPTGVAQTPPVTTCFKGPRSVQVSVLGVLDADALIAQATNVAVARM